MKADLFRQLPSVDQILQMSVTSDLIKSYGRPATVRSVRESLGHAREAYRSGRKEPFSDSALLTLVEARLNILFQPTIRPVINATGVVIHTNLGRSPLSKATQIAIAQAAQNYNTLEYDLDTGKRGSRSVHASHLITELIGAEAATVVNNNAAAVLLTLSALAQGREVIISRGQLIEIGGSFRIPDVMTQSGAKLVEVGATNRTHLYDYERAITENTAAIMVAHHSNFKIVGFSSEPELAELGALARERGVFLLHDLGSGTLMETAEFGLEHESTIQESLAAGTDIACFSGDKLLGGPQAGIILGKGNLVETIKRHPLARAVRPDKLCLAALTATLLHYLKDEVTLEIPIWRMIARQPDELKRIAKRWSQQLERSGLKVSVIAGESTVGGGSLPGETLATWLLAIHHPEPDRLAAGLRANEPAIIGRIEDQRLLLDPRTVFLEQEEQLLQGVLNQAT